MDWQSGIGGDALSGSGTEWFPGGTAVTRLRVYDWPAVDGVRGGSPHLHTVSTEGYVVLGGSGTLQTLSGDGYAEYPLQPGTLLWFTPGTVHRLVSGTAERPGEDLDILVVMQNAGLPEAGDAVLTFPPDVLADALAYAEAAALGTPADLEAGPQEPAEAIVGHAARRRRDLAVEGYLKLREQVIAEGPSALDGLYQAAGALVRERVAGWSALWQERTLAQTTRTEEQLTALAAGVSDHLRGSGVYVGAGNPGAERFGMCGRLRTWDLASAASRPR